MKRQTLNCLAKQDAFIGRKQHDTATSLLARKCPRGNTNPLLARYNQLHLVTLRSCRTVRASKSATHTVYQSNTATLHSCTNNVALHVSRAQLTLVVTIRDREGLNLEFTSVSRASQSNGWRKQRRDRTGHASARNTWKE